MSRFSTFLSGGFLAGRRTYLLVALAVATELTRWALGEQSLWVLLDRLPSIFGDLSIAALRAGVAASAVQFLPFGSAHGAVMAVIDEPIPDAVREWLEGQQRRV